MSRLGSDPDWVAVTVGQTFYRLVETGCQFNYAPSADEIDGTSAPQCELIMGFDRPTERERLGFQRGVFEAVLVALENIPFVCIRFGQTITVDGQWQHREAIGWQECPVHPLAAQGYVPPEPLPPQRWLLSAVLVDSETQRVAGIRVVSLSTEFCQRFAQAMNDHREDLPSPAAYAAKLGHLYARYGVGEVVAKGHMLAHCLGGD
jgi:hypothetical protein